MCPSAKVGKVTFVRLHRQHWASNSYEKSRARAPLNYSLHISWRDCQGHLLADEMSQSVVFCFVFLLCRVSIQVNSGLVIPNTILISHKWTQQIYTTSQKIGWAFSFYHLSFILMTVYIDSHLRDLKVERMKCAWYYVVDKKVWHNSKTFHMFNFIQTNPCLCNHYLTVFSLLHHVICIACCIVWRLHCVSTVQKGVKPSTKHFMRFKIESKLLTGCVLSINPRPEISRGKFNLKIEFQSQRVGETITSRYRSSCSLARSLSRLVWLSQVQCL